MDCPVDGTQLLISERAGVEIDYCPRCRGVWLDRGELDKILERSRGGDRADNRGSDRRSRDRDDDRRYGGADDYRRDDRSRGDYKKKRKKSGIGDFLDDIFDF